MMNRMRRIMTRTASLFPVNDSARLINRLLSRTCFLRLALVLSCLLSSRGTGLGAEVIEPMKLTAIRIASSAPPIGTAAESLRRFLMERAQSSTPIKILAEANDDPTAPASTGSILLGTTADHAILARWLNEGRLHIRASEKGAATTESDAYELAMLDGCIAVNGASPRAVLYATFELEDIISEHGGIPADLARRATPSLGLRLLHPRVRGGFGSYRQSDFEFLARCGGNVAHLTHDWMPEKTLFNFVPSSEFPKAIEAQTLEKNRDRLRQYLEWCKLYGLDGAMWLCEIPCQGGPWVPEATRQAFLDRFPAKCLSDTGTYQGKVLCLAHPQIEREYRRMVRQFLTDFPGISMFLVFTLDASGELCDPATCPRHHGVSKLTQYNRLLALMAEEGRKARPDFQVYSIGWGWKFRGEPDYFAQQAALPPGSGLTMPPDGEAWSFDRKTTDLLVKSRTLTREHKQPFLGYDIFFWGDDTVFGDIKDSKLPPNLGITKLYDFPLGVAAKMRRWQDVGADGFFDQWGTMAEYVQCNAIALRELTFHPENTAPDKLNAWALSLAARRFGAAAAPEILAAWQEIEAAQQIQSDHTYYWHHFRPAWSGPVLKTPLTLDALKNVSLSGGEPPKPSGDRDYSPYQDDVSRAKALTPALNDAASHFTKALTHLQSALALLNVEQPPAFDHWYHQPDSSTPTRLTTRQLIEEQIIAVRLQEQTQLRMSRFFQAWSLVKSFPPSMTHPHEESLNKLKQLRSLDDGPVPDKN